LVIVKPETLIGWHRKGFQLFWKWKSQAGRPRLPENIPELIVQMAQENPTWGQARVAAELSVKLGIYVSPRKVVARAVLGGLHHEYGGKGSPREGREELRGHCALIASPQFLVALRAGLPVPFVCSETHELGEELIGSHRHQVHLQHWPESSNHNRSCQTTIYI
jgi:putative transposase